MYVKRCFSAWQSIYWLMNINTAYKYNLTLLCITYTRAVNNVAKEIKVHDACINYAQRIYKIRIPHIHILHTTRTGQMAYIDWAYVINFLVHTVYTKSAYGLHAQYIHYSCTVHVHTWIVHNVSCTVHTLFIDTRYVYNTIFFASYKQDV